MRPVAHVSVEVLASARWRPSASNRAPSRLGSDALAEAILAASDEATRDARAVKHNRHVAELAPGRPLQG
ncbi:hypothetical protein GCM10018952_10700 [Streptosporangium vulgare]